MVGNKLGTPEAIGALASGAGDDPAKMEAELEGTTGGRTLVATATCAATRCSRYNFEWQ